MVSRKTEDLQLDVFTVGEFYTRQSIAEIGGVEPLANTREWTGIVEFNNCVVLFSTLVKDNAPPEYNYVDVFSDTAFYWESQNRNTQGSDVILKIISLDYPVLLFCRVEEKVKGKTQPFVFVGRLTAEDYDGEKPVEMRFNVDNYLTTPPDHLREIYEWSPGTERKLKPIEAPDRKPRIRSGQGRLSDPKKRKAVELRAMDVAKLHYEERGYAVTDTSANNPFDLECAKGDQIVRVEVKGIANSLGPVEVTIGEVLSARQEDCRTDLFIVYSISLKEKGKIDYEGEGGEIFIENDWRPREDNLQAIRYRYLLPTVDLGTN